MKIKVSNVKGGIDVTENDYILDNGACYQVITCKVGFGYHESFPMISKTEFNRLKKKGLVYLSEKVYHTSYRDYPLYGFKVVEE